MREMREMHKLAANAVATLSAGKHGDGAGLELVKTGDSAGYWVLRFSLHGRRREMGLGPIPTVTLKAARTAAAKARQLIAMGIDPIAAREKEREAASMHTFEAIARAALEAKKAKLNDGGVAGRWLSPLEVHVFPRIGRVPIAQLTQSDIETVLKPIWHSKSATAQKALDRISATDRSGQPGRDRLW